MQRGFGELARLEKEWVAVKEQLGCTSQSTYEAVSEKIRERMVGRKD